MRDRVERNETAETTDEGGKGVARTGQPDGVAGRGRGVGGGGERTEGWGWQRAK